MRSAFVFDAVVRTVRALPDMRWVACVCDREKETESVRETVCMCASVCVRAARWLTALT